jgi:hypothetical protein
MTFELLPTGQLDLFLHAGADRFANEVCNALLERDALRAADRILRLQSEAPSHPQLAAMRTLCAALPATPTALPDPDAVGAYAQWLTRQVEPASRLALGSSAPLFLEPLWHELAERVRQVPYQPDRAENFCAVFYLRGNDPGSAQRAALGIADHALEPAALHWLAVAGFRSAGRRAVRPPLFRLSWLAPGRAPAALAEIADPLLRADWSEFWTDCDWLDPQSDAGAWFPVWYLYRYPATRVPIQSLEPLPESLPVRAFLALQQLLDLEPGGHGAALIDARAAFRELAPELFALYMARRAADAGRTGSAP